MKNYIMYSKYVAKELDIHFPDTSQSKLHSWTLTTYNYTTTNARMFNVVQENMTLEYDSKDFFCKIIQELSRIPYNPYKDVF